MYRWILSLLALLGYTGMAANAQRAPQLNQTGMSQPSSIDVQQGYVISYGSSLP